MTFPVVAVDFAAGLCCGLRIVSSAVVVVCARMLASFGAAKRGTEKLCAASEPPSQPTRKINQLSEQTAKRRTHPPNRYPQKKQTRK